MRKILPAFLEAGRLPPPYGGEGFNGAFEISSPIPNYLLRIIASDGEGWDHVSVSLVNRCPNWQEMAYVKEAFWDEEEAVFQFHPPKSLYVNYHRHCLHLWKPQRRKILLPPPILVGPYKGMTQEELRKLTASYQLTYA